MPLARRWLVVPLLGTLWIIVTMFAGGFGLLEHNWFIMPTMLVGSLIAGATAEGGGAVAFPMLTLVIGIAPEVARDFTLMIQSVGMTAAAFTIVRLGLPVVWPAVVVGIVAAFPGLVLGMDVLAARLAPGVIKMIFVAFWLAFGAVLVMIARSPTRELREGLNTLDGRTLCLLAVGGLVGGVVVGLTGTGLDVAIFSVLVIGVRVNEAVATRTSIVLMGAMSLVGFGYRQATQGMAAEAWDLWVLAWPVVLCGAPLGAWLMRHRSPTLVRRLLLLIIAIQFTGALLIVPQTRLTIVSACVAFLVGLVVFAGLGMSMRGNTAVADSRP